MITSGSMGYVLAKTYEPSKPKVREDEVDKRLDDARAKIEGQKQALSRLR